MIEQITWRLPIAIKQLAQIVPLWKLSNKASGIESKYDSAKSNNYSKKCNSYLDGARPDHSIKELFRPKF